MTTVYSIGAFSKVIGAIDGTLIPVRAPAKDEHLYVLHKGFHAISVMAVCDAQMRFTNLVAKWHGSVHDSAIFNGSAHANKTAGRMVAWRQRLRPTVLPYDPLKS